MAKPLAFLGIGLFFGTGLGFLVAATSSVQLGGHDHDHGAAVHDHSAHDHGGTAHATLTEVTDPAPAMTLTLHPDGAQSRNLHIGVENFTFDPEGVNGPAVPGRGHAHLYLNGVKIARAYGPWMQLDALLVGTHELRVTLNANDHTQLASNGVPIETTIAVVIE
ncbi:MAG: hypothetical protein VR71_12220 [Roseovarius sp. BRH_c41]|uniref:hypothetical protein n=1 Tax=Roseovarius sp. BRH_c41 TaxID=1629709 RepID=UPI0005F0F589|nr:hypothetical protein [Roseovarius sp. BRH_c41]KJS43021.1 MAG: hypothetical protein VR71_12220 [Roseovarius sp. BRH_c41]